MLFVSLLRVSVLLLEVFDVPHVGLHVELSLGTALVSPEHGLDLAEPLLDDEQVKERDESAHRNPQVRRVVRIDASFGPVEEHGLDDVKQETETLRQAHERVQLEHGVREPDSQVEDIDVGQRHVEAARISRLDNLWHEAQSD